ncbi:MAG: acyltransferase [Spirochaetales bacterium]|nr:acyltransferase [Spirochaetales bacterium]
MRHHYLDNIRTLTVLLVVIYHVFYMFNGVAAYGVVGPIADAREAYTAGQYLDVTGDGVLFAQPQDMTQYLLYPWFMVLLFIVSGMSSRFYLNTHSSKEFAKSRTVKLLVPSTIGLLVFQWIQGYFNMRLSHVLDKIPADVPMLVKYLIMCMSGIGVLWYIQMLWIFSMVLLLVRMIERGRLAALCDKFGCPNGAVQNVLTVLLFLVLGVAAWGCFQILNTPVIVVYHFGIYGFVFFLGYYLFANENVIAALVKFRFLFAGFAVISGVFYVIQAWGKNYAVEPVVNSPSAVAYLWFMSLAILGMMKCYGDKTHQVMTFLNRRSWGLYVFHYLPLAALSPLLVYKTNLPPVMIYLLVAILSFVGGYLINEIVSRIPIVRWCVLGLRKEAVVGDGLDKMSSSSAAHGTHKGL